MAFVAIGFEQPVANMFFVPLGIFAGTDPAYIAFARTAQALVTRVPVLHATWKTFFVRNIVRSFS